MRGPESAGPVDTVPAAAAEHLLARASQLDAAAEEGRVSVAHLRRMAEEAGISTHAFDAALAEERYPERPASHWRRWTLAGVGAVLVATGALAVTQRSAEASRTSSTGVPMVDATYLMRCLSATEAIDVARLELGDRANKVVLQRGSRLLQVLATPAQHAAVKAALARAEAAAPTCAAPPNGR